MKFIVISAIFIIGWLLGVVMASPTPPTCDKPLLIMLLGFLSFLFLISSFFYFQKNL